MIPFLRFFCGVFCVLIFVTLVGLQNTDKIVLTVPDAVTPSSPLCRVQGVITSVLTIVFRSATVGTVRHVYGPHSGITCSTLVICTLPMNIYDV